MRHNLCFIFVISVLIFLAPIKASALSVKEGKTLVNLAGKQRMLSQKMSKEAAMVAAEIDVQQNLSNLRQTKNLFERTHKGFLKGDKDLKLVRLFKTILINKLDDVDNIWQKVKNPIEQSLANNKVSKNNLRNIYQNNPLLLKQSNIFTLMAEISLATAGDSRIGTLINMSGRQRMLTQKMSKEFFLILNGVDVSININNLSKTINLFESSLNKLIDGDEKLDVASAPNTRIKGQLLKIKSMWSIFKPNISSALNGSTTIENIDYVKNFNIPLLKESNKAVQLYTKL